MPPQGRLGDKSQAPADAHGCLACPHPVIGPAIQGSPTVLVNYRPALRVGDMEDRGLKSKPKGSEEGNLRNAKLQGQTG